MVPSIDGGDVFIRVGGPDEELWVVVDFVDEAVDGGLGIDDRAKDATLEAMLGEVGEQGLDSVSQE